MARVKRFRLFSLGYHIYVVRGLIRVLESNAFNRPLTWDVYMFLGINWRKEREKEKKMLIVTVRLFSMSLFTVDLTTSTLIRWRKIKTQIITFVQIVDFWPVYLDNVIYFFIVFDGFYPTRTRIFLFSTPTRSGYVTSEVI